MEVKGDVEPYARKKLVVKPMWKLQDEGNEMLMMPGREKGKKKHGMWKGEVD